MVMALTPATNSIKVAFPNNVIRTFIDDRTVVSPTASEALQICHEWSRWSRLLGLKRIKTRLPCGAALLQANVNFGVRVLSRPNAQKYLVYTCKGPSNGQTLSRKVNEFTHLFACSAEVGTYPWRYLRQAHLGLDVPLTSEGYRQQDSECRQPSTWRASRRRPSPEVNFEGALA